ncbi:cofactor assembly of complex C subunit B [Phormidium sp. CLA17]|uniref:cofactor assembly of complex C subunit B n=1 Tax=Leptolyngbya sp. Cla-17 TaxID=2803751 RepID=UPI001492676E|nr:cofactor assembly of complex C subunit B [Leptolyngbya sp. Cla-17]MBM0741507.1 cofactor assembly of complex C subunit B [Leptolyngbya sp. Cla-17]
MGVPVLSSTVFLTVLMLIGLVFFIRASVKDRTQALSFTSEQPEASLASQLQQYFTQRAYRVTTVDSEKDQITFEGIVRPSVFLAIFLVMLAIVGTLCLSLILVISVPSLSKGAFVPIIFSPFAGLFYWQKAKRPEKVVLKLEASSTELSTSQSFLTVIAHRDELLALQRALPLKLAE